MDDDSKFLHKLKKDPMISVGLAGFIGIVSYAVYNFKNRKGDIAMYVIHTRLAAQGAVIGSIALGMVYSLYTQLTKKFSKAENNKSSSSAL